MVITRAALKVMFSHALSTADAFEQLGDVLPDQRDTLYRFAKEERDHAQYLCHMMYVMIFPVATKLQPNNCQDVPKRTIEN